MKTLSDLTRSIDEFYTISQWELRIIKFAADSGSLLTKAEEFDIKDEELFNQFESFISAYKELVESLGMSASSLDPEVFENAAQLIDTLKKRYDRIITNPYLNVSDEEGYEEDFDPGEFTQFLSNIAQDAENKLKQAAGEDVDLSELRAAQYAQEFNNDRNIDRRDQNITWTGDKVRQNIEARRRWFEDLMIRKKLNINDERYKNYIQNRKNTYQNIRNDPERRAKYQETAAKRQTKFHHKLNVKKKEILHLLERTNDPIKRKELELELSKIDEGIEKRKAYLKNFKAKVKEKTDPNSLNGMIISLSTKLDTVRSETIKAVKKDTESKAASGTLFKDEKSAVSQAKSRLDNEYSPANKNLLEQAIRIEANSLKAYLDSHPVVSKVKQDLSLITSFRNKCKELDSMGWINLPTISEEAKPVLKELISEGEELINTFSLTYRRPSKVMSDIVNLIRTKL